MMQTRNEAQRRESRKARTVIGRRYADLLWAAVLAVLMPIIQLNQFVK